MRKIELLLAVMVCVLLSTETLSAQIAVRADVSRVGYTSINSSKSNGSIVLGKGIQFGADYDIHIKDAFYITPGLNWSFRTATEDVDESSVIVSESLREHFLNVPVHAKWRFDINPGEFGMYAYIGPVLSLGLSSRSKFEFYSPPFIVKGNCNYFSGDINFMDTASPEGISDELNDMMQNIFDAYGMKYSRIEARLELGVGFVVSGHNEIVLGCDFGLNNKLSGKFGNYTRITCSTAFIGYRFRFGKM